MKVDELAVVQGWPETVTTLRRWRVAPARRLTPWALGSMFVALSLLAATCVTTAIALPIIAAAAAVETWITPGLLHGLLPG